MIVRISNEPYVNCLELTWIFIKREFFTTMEFLLFYDQEERTWNGRAILWYIASVAIISLFLTTYAPIIPAILFSIIVTGAFTRLLQVSGWK